MLQPILATRIAAARSMLTTGVLVIGVARRKSQKHHMKMETGYLHRTVCVETQTHAHNDDKKAVYRSVELVQRQVGNENE